MVVQYIFGLTDMVVVNAYVLYKEDITEKLKMLEFRRELAQVLTLTQRKERLSPGSVNRRRYSICASVSEAKQQIFTGFTF